MGFKGLLISAKKAEISSVVSTSKYRMNLSGSLACGLALALAVCGVGSSAVAKAKATGGVTTFAEGTKPFGNPAAIQGGMFTINLSAEPATLNPITGTDQYVEEIRKYVLDTLMVHDPDTHAWIPSLAEKAEISADGQVFTFTLRKGAKFHDGQPVTAEDVKFSFDVIFDPKYNAAQMRPYFEGIAKAEIVDPLTVRFTTKDKYFGNFATVAGDNMYILPKHFYGDAAAGVKKNKTMMGSGPYKLEKYDQGQSLVLVRNKEWWGNNLPIYKGAFNFERVRARFIKESNIELEALQKGEIDVIGTDDIPMRAEDYVKKTDGPLWGKTVLKEKVENSYPKPFGYIGWNMKRDLFKDRDVRMALNMLANRAEMIKKFVYDMALPATGPWYQQNEYADPSVKATPFDPAKARELLAKAGWIDSDKDGVLDKMVNGKKVDMHFTLFYGTEDSKKYWELYQSDLKKSGVVMELQKLDWNALLKALDENKFDAAALSWGGGDIDYDPKQIWHSASIGKGGSNFVSYSNPEVDKMIDAARQEMDKKKRIPLLRKVYKAIANDAPYMFLFNNKYVLYAMTARIKSPKPTFKYEIGRHYWWSADGK